MTVPPRTPADEYLRVMARDPLWFPGKTPADMSAEECRANEERRRRNRWPTEWALLSALHDLARGAVERAPEEVETALRRREWVGADGGLTRDGYDALYHHRDMSVECLTLEEKIAWYWDTFRYHPLEDGDPLPPVLTLDEAIDHAREEAAEAPEASACAQQHRQLADWLTELKQLRLRRD